jgi:hypothetical protein
LPLINWRKSPYADGVTRNDFMLFGTTAKPQDLQAKVAVSVDTDILSVYIFQRKEIKREFESGRQEGSRL